MSKKLLKEDLQPLLTAASKKSAIDFENVFEMLITDKVADLVAEHKVELAKSFFSEEGCPDPDKLATDGTSVKPKKEKDEPKAKGKVNPDGTTDYSAK